MAFLRSIPKTGANWQRNLRILALAMYLLGTFAQGITLLLHETSHQWERVFAKQESQSQAHSHNHSHTHESAPAHPHAGWMLVVLQSEDLPLSDQEQEVQTEGLSVHMPTDDWVALGNDPNRSYSYFPPFWGTALAFPPDNPPPWKRSPDMLTLSGEGRV